MLYIFNETISKYITINKSVVTYLVLNFNYSVSGLRKVLSLKLVGTKQKAKSVKTVYKRGYTNGRATPLLNNCTH